MEDPINSSPVLRTHQLLHRVGPRLKQLQQVHGHLITTGANRNTSLLIKLAVLACSARNSSTYTRKLSLSITNPDHYLFNSLIRVSSKLGSPRNDAVFYYIAMLWSFIPPSNHTFTSLIKSCDNVSSLRFRKCVHCHAIVHGFGLDSYVQSGLVACYAKCGEVGIARKVFDEMPERSVVAWNGLVSGYERNGFSKKAIEVFLLMRDEGVEPDSDTFAGVLSACAVLGALELGSWVHDYIIEHGINLRLVVSRALITMYARWGCLRKAREVFDGMKGINVVSWTDMISGYGTYYGYGKEAIELYELMKHYGPTPSVTTFTAILSACAHAGMVEEGRRIFSDMTANYGLKPGVEHHVCMVDLLGRAGLLNEAYHHVKGLRNPDPAVWTALLRACKIHKNFDLGLEAADKLLALEPEDLGHYVILSNVYALAGRMDKVEFIRNKMRKKKLKKMFGCSSIIEVDQKPNLFMMGDKSHPEMSEIYQYLDELMGRISESGYVTAQESVLHEIKEEGRGYGLGYHSEMLAIAFGLMKTKKGCTIRIFKKLRMCEDCHLAIKFISRVTNREIIVRDKLGFHHFKDGVCSCGDYW